jgi:hypothetical protein
MMIVGGDLRTRNLADIVAVDDGVWVPAACGPQAVAPRRQWSGRLDRG